MDATNVIDNNYLTVLTSISLDHTDVLGNSLEEIAEAKCGIIKNGTYVVSIEQKKEAERVIKQACEKIGVAYSFASLSDIQNKGFDGLYQSFDYGEYKNIGIAMLGDYQLENAALALECIKALNKKGFSIPQEAVCEGMQTAHWGGRFEIIHRDPVTVIDGAHNPDAALRLKNSLELYFKGKRLLFIIGVFADKDYDKILSITTPLAEKIFAVKAPSPRALDTPELVAAVKKYNENAVESDLKSAVEYCLSQKDCVTVAFGSLSFMGDMTKYVRELELDEIQ
jgi:dihydrofolate synthase/folylpolyglutamate synthase